jgi:hypothetical protein
VSPPTGPRRHAATALTALALLLLAVAAGTSFYRYGIWTSQRLAPDHWDAKVRRLVAGPTAGWLPVVLATVPPDTDLIYVTDGMADPDWLAAYYLYPRRLHVRDSSFLQDPARQRQAREQGMEVALHRGHLLALPDLHPLELTDNEAPGFPPPPPAARGWLALVLLGLSAVGWGGSLLRLLRAPVLPAIDGHSLPGTRLGLALLAGLGLQGAITAYAALVGAAAHPALSWGLTALGLLMLIPARVWLLPASSRRIPTAGLKGVGPGSVSTSLLGSPLLRGGLLVILLLLMAAALGRGVGEPMHHWDERFQWAYKGKILLEEGGITGPSFQEADRPHLHRRYPLLLPGLEAHLARLAGGFQQERAVKALFPLFFAGFLLVTHGALRTRLPGPQALLLTTLLAALPPLHHAARIQGGPAHTGFADLPLGAFLAAATLALLPFLPANHVSDPETRRLRFPAGALPAITLFAGLAYLTKPEGVAILLAVLVTAALAAWSWPWNGIRPGQRQAPVGTGTKRGVARPASGVARALAAAALVLLFLLLPRLLLGLSVPTTGTVGYTGDEDYLGRLEPGALVAGLKNNFLPALLALAAAPFSPRWAFFGLLPLAGLLAIRKWRPWRAHLLLLLVVLPLAADLLAFVVTGSQVRWHLAVALDRLWMQLLSPAFVIMAGQMALVSSPGEGPPGKTD